MLFDKFLIKSNSDKLIINIYTNIINFNEK
jgi:hypothetical protein